eukprot:TRINITY_DN39342_c0_g1_i1.p1 TRINITY_DN39342_c0_g1~~TRINITY_DN39342_c0_g1_i1.p1  ORF type:complete len:118 (-),score=7.86 TRINITY_DN39342_c0_g1_i1:164-517(-)
MLVWVLMALLLPSATPRSSGCRLPRVNASARMPDGGSILNLMAELGGPVIISGAIEHWDALELWPDQQWFQRQYHHVRVPREMLVNATLNVAQDGPTGHDSGAVSYTHLTLPTKRIV